MKYFRHEIFAIYGIYHAFVINPLFMIREKKDRGGLNLQVVEKYHIALSLRVMTNQ